MSKQPQKIKIFVACHKYDNNVRKDDTFIPIQVGKSLHPELDLGFICDNSGDNISAKNSSYCELTALYWAWKNIKDVDYVGLCHYRRYFDFKSFGSSVRIIDDKQIGTLTDLDPHIHEMKENQVILPTFWRTPYSIWNNFLAQVQAQDLYILYKVLEKYEPSYLKTFERYMLGNKRTGYNMFVMSYNNFIKYCDWLFPLLSKVEMRVKESPYISYKRLYGYLGEILLPVYCIKNNLEIVEKRAAFCDGTPSKLNTKGRIQIKNFVYNISHLLGQIPPIKTLRNKYWEQYLKMDNIDI